MLGTCLQSMRSIVYEEADGTIGPSVAKLVLRALGVPDREAGRVVRRAGDVLTGAEVDPLVPPGTA